MLELVDEKGRVQRTYKVVKQCNCCGNERIEYPKLYEGYDSVYMNACHVRGHEYRKYERSLKGRWDSFKFAVLSVFSLDYWQAMKFNLTRGKLSLLRAGSWAISMLIVAEIIQDKVTWTERVYVLVAMGVAYLVTLYSTEAYMRRVQPNSVSK